MEGMTVHHPSFLHIKKRPPCYGRPPGLLQPCITCCVSSLVYRDRDARSSNLLCDSPKLCTSQVLLAYPSADLVLTRELLNKGIERGCQHFSDRGCLLSWTFFSMCAPIHM